MSEVRITRLYDILIDEGRLINEGLIKKGFTEEEIRQLLEEKIIVPIETNEYILSSVENFYKYGVKLLLIGYVKRANSCFRICNQIDPTDRKICLQLLYSIIKLGHYDDVFDRFSYIETLESGKYTEDNNLYLYLLSKLTGVPEEYKERVSQLNESSLLISDETEYRNKALENEIRINIMKNKYKYALSLLNNVLATDYIYSVHQTLIKELLIQIINAEKRFKFVLIDLAQKRLYGEILSMMEQKIKKRSLSHTDRCIYLIVKSIINIYTTQIVPPVISIDTNNLYEAIKAHDYILAKDLNLEFMKKHNLKPEEDVIDILLTDISELIETIGNNQGHELIRRKQKLND